MKQMKSGLLSFAYGFIRRAPACRRERRSRIAGEHGNSRGRRTRRRAEARYRRPGIISPEEDA